MTNILAFLHTTAAYQSAVLQLLIGEANFTAKELGLNEPALTTTNQLVEQFVSMPPLGISGDMVTSNYTYSFERGHLRSIRKVDWLKKSLRSPSNLLALAEQPSKLDTNSVLAYATQALGRLGFDLTDLERMPVRVRQLPVRKVDEHGRNLPGVSNNVATPLFQVSWGARSPTMDVFSPVFVKVLGTTPEVLEFHVRPPMRSRRAALRLTNAEALLGPLPPPRHFVEELFGGTAAYETVASPDKVEAWLLASQFPEENDDAVARPDVRTAPKLVPKKLAADYAKALLDFNTYHWTVVKACLPDYGLKLAFTRSGKTVEARVCFECGIVEIVSDGKARTENFDFGHNGLVAATKALFPKDRVVQSLKKEDVQGRRESFEDELKRMAVPYDKE